MFENIPQAPDDPILGLLETFKKDTRAHKVNLSLGVYCNEQGQTPILNVVKQVEKDLLAQEQSKRYLPIVGSPDYAQAVRKILLSEAEIDTDRVCVAQTIGGTGALRVLAELMVKHLNVKRVWVSHPTWANHYQVFRSLGLQIHEYHYYDSLTHKLAFDLMLEDLQQAQAGDAVLFHGCCHNPTGIDLNISQWDEVARLTAEKNLLPFFDFAYQGFGQGLNEDVAGLHLFLQYHQALLVASSFSKNLGLYGERVGACTVIAPTPTAASHVLSQLKVIIRTIYSSPSLHGGEIATKICLDPHLYKQWQEELTQMRMYLQKMRVLFVDQLQAYTGQPFTFLSQQQGMFSYTGLNAEQAQALKDDHAIYLLKSGRVNVSGLNSENIERVCQAINTVMDI